MKVYNMTSPRTGKAVPNQIIIKDDNKVYFQSYKTVICKIVNPWAKHSAKVIIDNGASYRKEDNDGADEFSRTTLKYLHKFLKENVPYMIDDSVEDFVNNCLKEDLNA